MKFDEILIRICLIVATFCVGGIAVGMIASLFIGVSKSVNNNKIIYINQEGVKEKIIDIPNDAYLNDYGWVENNLVINFAEREYDGKN